MGFKMDEIEFTEIILGCKHVRLSLIEIFWGFRMDEIESTEIFVFCKHVRLSFTETFVCCRGCLTEIFLCCRGCLTEIFVCCKHVSLSLIQIFVFCRDQVL